MESSPTTSKLLLPIVLVDCKLTALGAQGGLIASPARRQEEAATMLC